jgi:ribosomal protein S12 methylthiotransferase
MEKSAAKPPLRVGLISLGCAKNLVDAEIMLGSLLKSGVEITNDPAAADVMIVNTCSFIDSAQEESVDAILESDEVRQASCRGQGLVVSGCLPQRFREQLPKLLPEVDAFMGIDQVARVSEIVQEALQRRREKLASKTSVKRPGNAAKNQAKTRVVSTLARFDIPKSDEAGLNLRGTPQFGQTKSVLQAPNILAPLFDVTARPNYIPDYSTPRFRLTPKQFAYIKIAEGCNHPCSFCIIPRMRGSHRSRAQADIIREARALIQDGVKELNLISQDSTYYGLDLRPNHNRAIASPERFHTAFAGLEAGSANICSLLRELNDLPGEFWIRLLYTHPAHWTDQLIQTIAECPKVARYVDIPLQHIQQNMLEKMRRETSQQYIVDLLRRIRAGIPGIALRTTFIVGFPGETEAAFETLLDFVRETRFERLGVFTYSQEEATLAAKMAGQVPAAVKHRRQQKIMAAQREVARSVAEECVGRTLKVLVEGQATGKQLQQASIQSWEHGLLRGGETAPLRGRYSIARSHADAPDIDGRVYIRNDAPPGNFSTVKIVGHTDYDLIAEKL